MSDRKAFKKPKPLNVKSLNKALINRIKGIRRYKVCWFLIFFVIVIFGLCFVLSRLINF